MKIIVFVLCSVVVIRATTPEEQENHPNFKLLPQAPNCSNPYGLDRIVGGTFAKLGQFPWLVRLGYLLDNCDHESNQPMFVCAGSLITPNIVLTASHCIKGVQKLDCPATNKSETISLKMVRLGELDQTSQIDCENDTCSDATQDIVIKSIRNNKDYDPVTLQNDIAILELEEDAKFTDWVNPVCLPVGKILSKDYVGASVQVAGWGKTGNSNDLRENSPDILNYINLPVKNMEDCKPYFKSLNPEGGQLCVGGEKGQDSCTGDSGGPLIVVNSESTSPKAFQIGIVSFGNHICGKDGVPAVYTDVRDYMGWVLDNLTA